MRIRRVRSIGAALIFALLVISLAAAVKSPAAAPALQTPWGEPDLQGIWTDESDTPLQRPAKYASQELYTEAQRQELDKERAAMLRRDRRVERGTELDVAGAYNAVFMSQKRTGTRTSLIADPPNGRLPPLTPQAEKAVPPPTGISGSLCCNRRRPARPGRWPAAAANTIRRRRRGARSCHRATTPGE